MGIQNLNKILTSFGLINTIQSLKLKNEESYNNICEMVGFPYFNNFICHYDFPIMFYKFAFTSSSMEETYNKIKNALIDIKNNNNEVILYIDPEHNIRKKDLHLIRHIQKQKTIIKDTCIINEQIENIKTLKPSFNYQAIASTSTTEITYDEYLKNLSSFESNKKKNNSSISVLEDKKDFSFDSDIEKDIAFLVVEDKKINDTFNIIKKRNYSLFLNNYKFYHHIYYIIESLLSDNIINKENIVKSDYLDAELCIIDNIKKNFSGRKNLIYSTDQDIILFSLLHYKDDIIYFKTNLSYSTNDIYYIKKNNLTINICLLVFFFNKSDYFKGVKKFNITEKRLSTLFKKTDLLDVLSKRFENSKDLVLTYMKYFLKSNQAYKNYVPSIINNIDKLFENIELYFKMEIEFFNTKTNHEDITYDDIMNYLIFSLK